MLGRYSGTVKVGPPDAHLIKVVGRQKARLGRPRLAETGRWLLVVATQERGRHP